VRLDPAVFDVWVWRRAQRDVEYLLLHTSRIKADRFFNGGRFWQIPSDRVHDGEKLVQAIERTLGGFGITALAVWAAEQVYTIYNRRFDEMQIIGVYAAQAAPAEIRLDPEEHAEYRWCGFEEALALVGYRGLKDGLRSTREYVTGGAEPRLELRLK
jgi:NUDIX domain